MLDYLEFSHVVGPMIAAAESVRLLAPSHAEHEPCHHKMPVTKTTVFGPTPRHAVCYLPHARVRSHERIQTNPTSFRRRAGEAEAEGAAIGQRTRIGARVVVANGQSAVRFPACIS